MKEFRTPIGEIAYPFAMKYSDCSFFLGSCFAQNVGSLIAESGLNAEVNPFGPVYNPASLLRVLESALAGEIPQEYFVAHGGKWYSMLHSTLWWGDSREELSEKLHRELAAVSRKLLASQYLFLTFGTAWVYTHRSGVVVNNCLKIPATQFVRSRLTVEEIVVGFRELIDRFPVLGDKKIILTVSPIRHLKDGFAENTVSKSVLLLAAKALTDSGAPFYYFPAFELMNDDLRDYRFYEQDMIHPNATAVSYIFDRFAEALFDPTARGFVSDYRSVASALAHRPFDAQDPGYARFCETTIARIAILEKKYPGVCFDKQRAWFAERLEELP